jgi:anti-sigma factor RsiW
VTVVELGGPKSIAAQSCSALLVRRLIAGELSVDESVTVEAHLQACAKCRAVRAEVEGEKRALAEAVPFDAFAAGVAEKLAQAELASEQREPLGARVQRWARSAAFPLAIAASCFLVLRVASGPGPVLSGEHPPARVFQPTDNLGALKKLQERQRTKGGVSLKVFAVRGARTFALRAGQATEQDDRLLPSLEPAGHDYALVALVEPGEVSVLFVGPAHPGPLSEAFEWTGSAPRAQLAAVYGDTPLDEAAVVAALREGKAAGLAEVQVVFHALERKGAQPVPQ